MRIRLMSHIPYNLIIRQFQAQMQRHGQFHRAQVGTQMPAGYADFPDQELADLIEEGWLTRFFLCQRLIVLFSDLLDIVLFCNFFQKHVHTPLTFSW